MPKLATLMDSAAEAVLACMRFPAAHRTELCSTHPVECLNGETKRRIDVVGIFPIEAAVLRLVGAILFEQSDEWATQRSRDMTLEASSTVSDTVAVSASLTRRTSPPMIVALLFAGTSRTSRTARAASR